MLSSRNRRTKRERDTLHLSGMLLKRKKPSVGVAEEKRTAIVESERIDRKERHPA